ncbi:bifunctional aldehyde dehydrogenase/enoyl-CoA hydratase (plasmid) [Pseudosulfitobacter pseudonitzschiae]|uniref:Bifunctional aldehyde dehydrogenase/enoyl-CoA hydratase n=1 Tax=Pseudosulfitobacter pseudonitzschiae TaxID=1402135 RepID=A0A221K8P6_9RHOB|nr:MULTISPECIES: MaoC family dehydratase [Roseobacteraceae]ASM75349.1 bifunctional aldehyde dehydrogenase/enoyl-CoA hydratase [Pseudosulfitobacter pseudonitzschiae]
MKYLEDFSVGQVFEFRSAPLTKQQIKEFAQEWDPQRLHTDEAYAEGIHGGLIASGFQTLLTVFKPIMQDLMVDVANIGGIGFDQLRWLRPVRPEEPLNIRIEVQSLVPSRSKPDRGVLIYTLEARNPAGELVMSVETPVMIQRRKEDLK